MQIHARSRALLMLSMSFFVLPVSGWAQDNSSGPKLETIRIGVSGPFSGGSSQMGESMRNGIRLAVDEINAIGGVNGRKIELLERDDAANPEVGAKIAQEFVQQKVAAAIGIVNTGVGVASIDFYQKAKIPLMVAVSTGTSLTRKYAPPAAPENYIFRMAPTLDLEAKVLSAELKRKGLSRVAVIADSTAYGDAGLKALDEQSKAIGITIASIERFNVGDTDMSAQVRNARASGAQALVAWGIGPELAVIAHNKNAAGWKAPLLGSWTFSMRSFIDAAGHAGEGTLMPQTFVQDIGVTSKNSFLLSYRRVFKTDQIQSPMSAAQGYDGMHLLYFALRQANSTEGMKIAEALEDLKFHYQGAISNYTKPFSKGDHDAITQNMLVIGVVSNGRIDFAYAEDKRRGALLRTKAH
jgi:branched-chain amino acid transport system substrate-binding protein